MKITKSCFALFVACLIATTLAIPASAANTSVGTTETIQLSNGNSITITNVTSAPFGHPLTGYDECARTVNLPFKIQLNGKNIQFDRASGYRNGSFNIREEQIGVATIRHLEVDYNLKPNEEVIGGLWHANNGGVVLTEPALYLIEIQNGDQLIRMWIQAYATPKPQAYPTPSTVKVDGKAIPFDSYNINDNNYFKLRDIAKVLDGTGKQFNVLWDGAKNSIIVNSNKPYQAVGGELVTGSKSAREATPTTSSVYVDDTLADFTAYNIKDNNYFKLRDIAERLNFGVTWDGTSNTVYIDTTTGYTP